MIVQNKSRGRSVTTNWKMTAYRAIMDALYFSGTHRLFGPAVRGCGLVYMLHRVVPARDGAFQPNAFLEVTPDFLDRVIRDTRAAGVDFVSADEAHRRLVAGEVSRRFAVVTLDDGYRDNLEHALPVFRRHEVPFTVFAASDIAERTCELWWLALERIIAGGEEVRIDFEGRREVVPTASLAQKDAAYEHLSRWLASELDEHAQRRAIRLLSETAGVDLAALCRSLTMDWDELRTLAQEPLATIGSHTRGHHAVARLSEEEAREQIAHDVARHEAELGARPRFLAYPYGGPQAAGPRDFDLAAEFGFRLAVTTRPGHVFPEHRDHLLALPRVSLNGLFQKRRYAALLRDGTPFALANRLRRVNVG